jgi:long-subunit fatty acid transport protein
MKALFGFFALIGFTQIAFSQNEDDALRYSQIYFGGTARSVSTAGSFGAVGGDYSVVSTNPAGLGRFKKNNFSFSQAIEVPNATTSFYGTDTKAMKGEYKISNISYVRAYRLDPKKFSNWYSVQLGLGYNRLHSFEEKVSYGGTSDSSILHSFIKRANGTMPENIYYAFPFDAGLAYDTYALDPGPDNTYVTDFTSGNAIHHRNIYRSGGLGEYSFTLSGNYANKLLVGGTFNLTRLKYSESYEHTEEFTDSSLWIRDIRYLYNLDIKGWGYGARVGAIFMPADWIRIGASVQSPTFFRNKDEWDANMYTDSDDGLKYVAEENVPSGSYDYTIQTPLRANFNLGLVHKKIGSLGIDVEYVDHSSSVLADKKFSESPYTFNSENAQIKNLYRSVLNVRIGAEARVNENLYVRGGFAHFSSAFKNGKGNIQYPTNFFTGGVGCNFGSFYIDAAIMLRRNKADYYAYDPTINGSHARIDYSNTSLIITTGFRFE